MKVKFSAVAAALILAAGVSFPVVAQQCPATTKAGTECVCSDQSQCKGGKCEAKCTPCASDSQTCSQKTANCQNTQGSCGSSCACSVTSCKK